MESIGSDISQGYASCSKVPALAIGHEAKWQHYNQQLSPLALPRLGLSRFLSQVCAPPCQPDSKPIEGWKLILPCLTRAQDWEIPVACWNEVERALRNARKRPCLLLGLTLLHRECPELLAAWLGNSPHNLCRTALALGRFENSRAQRALERARRHPVWQQSLDLQRWAPLRPPDWLCQGLAQGQDLSQQLGQHQARWQMEVLYLLLRS